MYAIIKASGKQHKVVPGQRLTLDRVQAQIGETLRFDEVLLVSNDAGISVGSPTVSSAYVSGVVVGHFKSKKVLVFKKRRRHNYRRRKGHRDHLTTVLIQQINA